MVYKSIVFLDNEDPFNEAIHTYANYTMEKALLYFLVDNARANGIVLVHQDGAFKYYGTIEDVKKMFGVTK